MKRFKAMSVLVLGLDGLGAAVAKDLILTGPKAVSVLDAKIVEPRDLGRNPFLTEASVGGRVDESCLHQLAALNATMRIDVFRPAAGDGTTVGSPDIAQFDAVVACDGRPMAELEALNALCRATRPAGADATGRECVAFYVGEVRGAVSRMFCDMGPSHEVLDANGMVLPPYNLEGLTPVEGHPRRLMAYTGTHVAYSTDMGALFRGVAGPLGAALCDGVPRRIVSTGKYGFEIELEEGSPDAADLGAWEPCTATCGAVNLPKTVTCRALSDSRSLPYGDAAMDMQWGMVAGQLHAAFEAADAYAAKHGSTAELQAAAEGALAEAVELGREACDRLRASGLEGTSSALPEGSDVDADTVRHVAGLWGAQLLTASCHIGSLLAHEVFKLTGKFTPCTGWFYADHRAGLPRDGEPLRSARPPAEGRAPSRYDDVIDVLGPAMHRRLLGLRVFLVGSGAVGCEYLKLLPLLGVACGEGGLVTVTDMDSIEVSNLSRQFLFRDEHVGASKSTVAVGAARAMNPAFHAEARLDRVGPATETVFGPDFWAGLDVVVAALDNVQARLYVQHKCVQSRLVLLDAGTQGGAGSSEPFVPGVTDVYADDAGGDDTAAAIPMCTLKKFPTLPVHCIEFARSEFEGLFVEGAEAAAKFRDADALLWVKHCLKVQARQKAEKKARAGRKPLAPEYVTVPGTWALAADKLAATLLVARVAAHGTWDACVRAAVLTFQSTFHDPAASLLHSFPADRVVTDRKTGAVTPYWSGTKRAPVPLSFDASRDDHLAFVSHAATVFAAACGVSVPEGAGDDREALRAAASLVDLPPFRARLVTGDDEEDKEEDGEGGKAAGAAASSSSGKAEAAKAAAAQADEIDARIAAGELLALARDHGEALSAAALRPEPFEKDSTTNRHVDFVTALANLRGESYGIPPTPRHEVKITAGRIIPAIATTTDCVTAFGGLLLIQTAQGEAAHGRTTHMSAELSLHQHMTIDIEPPAKVPAKAGETRVPADLTVWNRVDVSLPASATVADAVREAETRLLAESGGTVDTLSVEAQGHGGGVVLWSPLTHAARSSENEGRPLRDVAAEAGGLPPAVTVFTLKVTGELPDGNVALLPSVVVTIEG